MPKPSAGSTRSCPVGGMNETRPRQRGVGGISDRKLIGEYVRLGARIVATGTDIGIMMEVGTELSKFVASLSAVS